MNLPKPVFRHQPARDIQNLDVRRARVRTIEHESIKGVLLDDPFGGIVLGEHNLERDRGSLAVWILPIEDLHTAQQLEGHRLHISAPDEFTILSDRETVIDSRASHFALVWSSFWTPSLYAKRFPGYAYDAFKSPPKAMAAAGHFAFEKARWYHVAYSWDTAASRHRLFVNGILVGHSDASASASLQCSPPGPYLCCGSTMIATGDVTGYDEELGQEEWSQIFRNEATSVDDALQEEMERTYLGKHLPALSPPPEDHWKSCQRTGLTQAEDLRRFHIQGCAEAPRITPEGLRITTPGRDPAHDFSVLDLNHVYLWSRDWFEGDLHLSYEFSNLKPGGLSLLMLQCSGMQREDFLRFHKPRTNGIMRPVCWEDIRNYHWEYFREMSDVRNDVASHALLKNPWFRPLGFGIHGPRYALKTWHRLDFVQIEDHIQCAIDGDVVIDTHDIPHDNNGPVLAAGRFAIRCMTRTDMLFRNLVIRSRPHFQ